MPRYRQSLPQLGDRIFLTDGGLETWLVFMQGVELPSFAAFPLVDHDSGRALLLAYFEPYLRTARDREVGFILSTPTWRANHDWGERVGYSPTELAAANQRSVEFVAQLRDAFDTEQSPVVIDGMIGPRGDGYRADVRMSAWEAEEYHREQIDVFRSCEADMVSALTLTYAEEAIGIAQAAKARGLPVAISFTLETDGRLPSGESLPEAIGRVDAATGDGPAYYMINCAHPTHLGALTFTEAPLRERLRGFRANASALSHAELDMATELDTGDPKALGSQFKQLRNAMANLTVLGGCCGTDHRHCVAICEACLREDDQSSRNGSSKS